MSMESASLPWVPSIDSRQSFDVAIVGAGFGGLYALHRMRERGYDQAEATPTAVEGWVAHVNEIAGRTLYPTCNSWYLGANIPGKPRVFMPYLGFPPC